MIKWIQFALCLAFFSAETLLIENFVLKPEDCRHFVAQIELFQVNIPSCAEKDDGNQ